MGFPIIVVDQEQVSFTDKGVNQVNSPAEITNIHPFFICSKVTTASSSYLRRSSVPVDPTTVSVSHISSVALALCLFKKIRITTVARLSDR